MDKVSFKQYQSFMEASDEDIEQLEEGFGEFFSKTFGTKKPSQSSLDKLKAQREKLKSQKTDKEKEIQKKQDELWARAKKHAESGKPAHENPRLSLASKNRAAEMDWIKGITSESFTKVGIISEGVMSKVNLELKQMMKSIEDGGEIELHDILKGKYRNFSNETVAYLNAMYDTVSIDFHLHPDDDFEKIESKMMDILEKTL